MPLTWTTNGNVWLALHGDQWAKIQRVNDHDCPFHAYIGDVIPIEFSEIRIEHEIDTERWHTANKTFDTLEEAQAWAEEKLGVER
jgi:hypothetical protein